MAEGSEYYSTYDWSGDISQRRLATSGLPPGAEPVSADATTATFTNKFDRTGDDWRVKISLPNVGTFKSSPMLEPLKLTNNALTFPLQPTITFSHTADYDVQSPVHSNYSYPIYSNSRIEDINIVGEFPVQSPKDGTYWAAVIHFLRSATKMFYGDGSNKGGPPPICHLSGYGDYVLKKVPVVITAFSTDLPNNVDYIRSPIYVQNEAGNEVENYVMAPTLSTISVVVKPIYSRSKIETFSLDKFVNGQLIDKGFI